MKRTLQISLLAWFGFLSLVSGFFAARHMPEPGWWVVLSGVVVSATIFYWYRVDSTEKAFRRSFLLNVGVVALAIVAIPLYIFQSTERGLRSRALGRMLGYFCLVILVSVTGGVIGAVIG